MSLSRVLANVLAFALMLGALDMSIWRDMLFAAGLGIYVISAIEANR